MIEILYLFYDEIEFNVELEEVILEDLDHKN